MFVLFIMNKYTDYYNKLNEPNVILLIGFLAGFFNATNIKCMFKYPLTSMFRGICYAVSYEIVIFILLAFMPPKLQGIIAVILIVSIVLNLVCGLADPIPMCKAEMFNYEETMGNRTEKYSDNVGAMIKKIYTYPERYLNVTEDDEKVYGVGCSHIPDETDNNNLRNI